MKKVVQKKPANEIKINTARLSDDISNAINTN